MDPSSNMDQDADLSNSQQNESSISANSALPSRTISHQYDNITLSGNSRGIFGNILAQNVNLSLNGGAQTALRTIIGEMMTDVAQSKRQHKISKSKKHSSRSRHRRAAARTQARADPKVLSGTEEEEINNTRNLHVVASSRLSSQAERKFTRELLQRLGVIGLTRVHHIDDLPYMRIALRMSRAIDAYITNWTMTEGERDVYRGGEWIVITRAFHDPENASLSMQKPSTTAIRRFESVRDELSPQTLVILLLALRESPEQTGFVAKLCKYVLGRNHPVTFICNISLVGQTLPLWREIVFHYVFDWVGRMILEYGSGSENVLDNYLEGPARLYWRLLEVAPVNPAITDPELRGSCLREAIAKCASVYSDNGYSINTLRQEQATLSQKSGDIPGAMKIYHAIYHKITEPDGPYLCSLKARAAHELGDIFSKEGNEREARSCHLEAIKWFHMYPDFLPHHLQSTILELHRLTSSRCGYSDLEALMHEYPEYWTLAQCGHIVLRDLDFLFETYSDSIDTISVASSDASSEYDSSDFLSQTNGQ